MIQQSLWTSLIASNLAAKFLKEEGTLVLTGAQPALSPTPGMIGYGVAKVLLLWFGTCIYKYIASSDLLPWILLIRLQCTILRNRQVRRKVGYRREVEPLQFCRWHWILPWIESLWHLMRLGHHWKMWQSKFSSGYKLFDSIYIWHYKKVLRIMSFYFLNY